MSSRRFHQGIGACHGNGLRQAMLDAAKPHLFRIIGPNTVGLMIPPAKLKAGFAHMAAKPGNVALLLHSGALATSLIDWAADNNVGFSHIVSLGDMADMDVGDWLDMLVGDGRTRAIVLYLETITNPRKFMSATCAAARIIPGALSGPDRVFEAALARAGILRMDRRGPTGWNLAWLGLFSPEPTNRRCPPKLVSGSWSMIVDHERALPRRALMPVKATGPEDLSVSPCDRRRFR